MTLIEQFLDEDTKFFYKAAINNIPLMQRRAYIYDILSKQIKIRIPEEKDMIYFCSK